MLELPLCRKRSRLGGIRAVISASCTEPVREVATDSRRDPGGNRDFHCFPVGSGCSFVGLHCRVVGLHCRVVGSLCRFAGSNWPFTRVQCPVLVAARRFLGSVCTVAERHCTVVSRRSDVMRWTDQQVALTRRPAYRHQGTATGNEREGGGPQSPLRLPRATPSSGRPAARANGSPSRAIR